MEMAASTALAPDRSASIPTRVAVAFSEATAKLVTVGCRRRTIAPHTAHRHPARRASQPEAEQQRQDGKLGRGGRAFGAWCRDSG